MRKSVLFPLIITLLLIINCAEKRGALNSPPSPDSEWLYGQWLNSPDDDIKFTFNEDESFVIRGYGGQDGLVLSGDYDIWSDDSHIRLNIASTTSPYEFPVGWYSGYISTGGGSSGAMELHLDRGMEFPESSEEPQFSWEIIRYEADVLNISFFELTASKEINYVDPEIPGAIVLHMPVDLEWEQSGYPVGYNIYRFTEGHSDWEQINTELLPATWNTYKDYYEYSPQIMGYNPYPVYQIEAVQEDPADLHFSVAQSALNGPSNVPILELTRLDHDDVSLRWTYNEESLMPPCRLYRVFHDPANWNSWEVLTEHDFGLTEMTYTDNIEWGDYSIIYYSLVTLTVPAPGDESDPLESPRCMNMKYVLE